MKIQLKTLIPYIISNIIGIGIGKLIPLKFLPWWLLFCICAGYFINQRIYKNNN